MSSRLEVSAEEPRTVDEAKHAIEQSRQRISSTLDALEDRIVEKKHAIQDRVDVLRPVREQVVQRPFAAVAVALGVGAVLGSLSSGTDEGGARDGDSRDRTARRRTRRQRLRARLRHREHEADEADSPFASLRHQLARAITSAIGAAVTARVKDMSRGSGRRA